MPRLGNNGGLMGLRRVPSTGSASGVWDSDEQSLAKRAGIWPFGASVDPYFADVSLLLHMNGSNGSTSFPDSGPGNALCTARGGAVVNTSQFKFGSGSLAVNATSPTCVTCDQTGIHAFGTADFTIEGWVYLNTLGSDKKIFDCNYGNGIMLQLYPGTSSLYIKGTNYDFDSTYLPTGQWVHFAVTRASGAVNLWLNGVSRASGTNTSSITSASELAIGASSSNRTGNIDGYVDEFRITKNIARYTSSFTPPDAPFPDVGPTVDPYWSLVSLLLRMDGSNGSTTFTDLSNYGHTITAVGNAQVTTTDPKFGTGALLLDGAGDYLETPAHSSFAFGTGDFTVECWVYPNIINDNDGLFTFGTGQLHTNIYANDWYAGTAGSGGWNFGAATAGAWQHFALTRSGSTLRMFINGTQISNAPDSTNLTNNQLFIGYYFSSVYGWDGKIDEFRVTKGAARYTSNFTPPTAPFPVG